MGLLLEAAPLGPGLLGHIEGTCVDDIAPFPGSQRCVQQLFILPTALPVGARQWLPTAHDDLGMCGEEVRCGACCPKPETLGS